MSRRNKMTLKVTGAVLLLLVIAVTFVPLRETHYKYCFYCGRESLSARILGIPVTRYGTKKGFYRDHILIPDHSHRMIECNGSEIWAFRGQQFWDEFGWTGRLYRDALVEGIDGTPELEKEIVVAYLRVDPEDREGAQGFLNTYGKKRNRTRHRTE